MTGKVSWALEKELFSQVLHITFKKIVHQSHVLSKIHYAYTKNESFGPNMASMPVSILPGMVMQGDGKKWEARIQPYQGLIS